MGFVKRNQAGFTLVEILIVMAIIAILAGLTLRSIMGSGDKAKIGRAKSEISQILRIIQQIEVDTGCWPKSPAEVACKVPYVIESGVSTSRILDLNDAKVGITGDTDGAFPSWGGPYMAIVHKDPWGNQYFFDTAYDLNLGVPPLSEAAVIGSLGPDVAVGTADDVLYTIVGP